MADSVEVGVPVITQLELLIVAHTGKAGKAVQDVIMAPLLFKIEGATVIVIPTPPLVPELEA